MQKNLSEVKKTEALELDPRSALILKKLGEKRRQGDQVNDRFEVHLRDGKDVRANLPLSARNDLEEFKDKERGELTEILRIALAETVDPDKLEEAVGIAAKAAVNRATKRREDEIVGAYLDRRRQMGDVANENYMHDMIVDYLDRAMTSEEPEKELASTGVIFIDADGLKTVNDFSSYEAGDQFLRKVVEVLNNPNGSTRTKFKKRGIEEFIFTSIGGDEFGIILKADKAIDDELLAEVISDFQDEVSAIDMSNLINFKSEKFLLHFGGISEKEFGSYTSEKKVATLEKVKAKIPTGAKFYATFSAGGTNLLEAINDAAASTHDRRLDIRKDSYGTALEKIRAQAKQRANLLESTAKANYKNDLRHSGDPLDQFRAELLARSLEARNSIAAVRDMRAAIRDRINLEYVEIPDESTIRKTDPEETTKIRKMLNPSNLRISLEPGETFNMMEHTNKAPDVPNKKKKK